MATDVQSFVFIKGATGGIKDAAQIARVMEEGGISVFSIVPWEDQLYVCGKVTATLMDVDRIGRHLKSELEDWGLSTEDV